ncbi:MAG: peptidoglycan DD-metalloendopeptidase family protein [Paracoccaceae bacterium]
MASHRRREDAARAALALVAALALAGCAGGDGGGDRAGAPPAAASGGGGPSTEAASPAMGRPDARGVIRFEDYAVIQAREGDTVEALAERVGLPPSELAAYNGLPVSYRPRPGDELVLPPRAGGYDAAPDAAPRSAPAETEEAPPSAPPGREEAQPLSAAPDAAPSGAVESEAGGWSSARIGAAIERSGADGAAVSPAPDGPAPATDADGSAPATDSDGTGRDVAYHDVEAGETIYSIARRYGVAPETLIAWNALSGPDYRVTEGQVLTIPAGGEAADDGMPSEPTAPGRGSQATPPPSAGRVLPPDTVPPPDLASPQLSRYQTETAPDERPAPAETAEPVSAPESGAETRTAATEPSDAPEVATGKLLPPHPGRIVRPYSREAGAGRNDGVDFAASPGDPVRASADGEVALVSTSLGEWGTIVLVRHDERLMTVYGRLGETSVTKGQRVSAGEEIGRVAAPESGSARLHFEVRRGAVSEDPAEYL